MHSVKGVSDGIRVNPDESEIPSIWKIMNAFLMHDSALYKRLS